jgi:hypothetical protein
MNNSRLRGLVATFVTLLGGVVLAGLARSQIYVVNNLSGTIGEYTVSGAPINASLISGLSSPWGIALGPNGHLYVPSHVNWTIGEYTLSGAAVHSFLISYSSLTGAAVDSSGNIFVGDSQGRRITELNSSGAVVNRSLISGLSYLNGIEYDGRGHLFVMNGQTIGEYNTDGSAVNAALITGASNPYGIGFDSSGRIYVPQQGLGTISLYSSSGTLLVPNLVSGLSYPLDVEVSPDGFLYVLEGNLGQGRVSEFTLSGQDVNRSLITGLVRGPVDLIVMVPEPRSTLLLVIALPALLTLRRRERYRLGTR